jgi:hypothetical protein
MSTDNREPRISVSNAVLPLVTINCSCIAIKFCQLLQGLYRLDPSARKYQEQYNPNNNCNYSDK